MRTTLIACILGCAPALEAQGVAGGRVVDATSGKPLPCVDVALTDSAGDAVAHARTSNDGTFQVLAPAEGKYRLRFSIDHYPPVWGPEQPLKTDSTVLLAYQVNFIDRVLGSHNRPPSDTLTNAPAWPIPSSGSSPRYPRERLALRLPGEVLAQFVVDTTGRVEGGSTRILHASHPAFGVTVATAIRQTRFQPARRAGQRVCSLWQQPFSFTFVP